MNVAKTPNMYLDPSNPMEEGSIEQSRQISHFQLPTPSFIPGNYTSARQLSVDSNSVDGNDVPA